MMKISACLVALLGLSAVSAAPVEDQMKSLPDIGNFSTNAYSGYLNVSDTKALHYTFVESQDKPSKDPVLIWFNGGPGCSSLLAFF